MTTVAPGAEDGPSISVVIPVRNEEPRIGACLRALSQQATPPLEIIVVDNGSTDGTASRVSQLQRELTGAQIRLISEERRGAAASRNRGVALASGDIVAFTDGDCVPAEDWIERILGSFQEPGLGGVGGISIIDEPPSSLVGRVLTATWLPDRTHARASPVTAKTEWFRGVFLSTFNCAFRRTHLEEIGGFDESLERVGEDMDLWIRAHEAGVALKAWEPTIRVRHDQDMSVLEMLRKMYGYGIGLALVTGLHFRGAVFVQTPLSTGFCALGAPLTLVLWRHFAQASLFAAALLVAWFITPVAAIALFTLGLGALAFRLRAQLARDGRGVTPLELMAAVALYLGRHVAREAGMLWGSLRYRVVCL